MQSELPDLDEEISFVVDHGASVGPLPMSDIISSVRDGDRDGSALIWWAGATDWIQFDSHDELVAMSNEPALEVFEPQPAAVAETPEAPSVFEPAALTPIHSAPEPEPEVFEPQPAAAPIAEPVAEVQPEPVVEPAALVVEPTHEPVAEAAAASVAAEPAPAPVAQPVRTTTDDDGWSSIPDLADPLPTAQAPVAETVTPDASNPGPAEPASAAPAEVDDDAFSFNLPTREASDAVDDLTGRPAITGLFSSGSRIDSSDPADAPTPSPDALDAILAARTSLESVGARIEALSSATKASLTPEQIQSGVDELADPAETPQVTLEEPTPAPASLTSAADAPAGSWTSVEAEPAAVAAAGTTDQSAARAELTERFKEMVAKSDEHQRRIEWVTRVDELLLSTCITAIADSGYVAVDLNSQESDHTVLFDHTDDVRKVRLELSPLETVSARLGRHVTFGLAWGRDVSNPDRAFEIVRQNTDDAPVPPGVITCEADMVSSSVSTQVNLILAADDFVKDDYSVDRPLLDSAIAAALHALEGHWHALFDNVQ